MSNLVVFALAVAALFFGVLIAGAIKTAGAPLPAALLMVLGFGVVCAGLGVAAREL